MTSRYLEFTKLAVNPSSSSASLTAIGEGKPPMKSGKGYNVNMGLYPDSDNSQSDWTNSIESATGTASPTQPTGKVTSTWAADNDQRLRHLNGVVYDRWGTKISSETNATGVSTTVTQPAGASAVNPANAFESSVADANYTDPKKLGASVAMNMKNVTPFQTDSKIDTITAASRALDWCLEKTASYVHDPSETHFQRLLRKEGEKAIAAGDMEKATKLAVASNALAFLEKVKDGSADFEEPAEDKTAAGMKERGLRLLINDAVLKAPKSGVKNIFEAGQRVVNPATMGPTQNLFNTKGKPHWRNIANLMNNTPGFRPHVTTTPEEAKALYKALGNPYLRAAKQWIYENPVRGNAILGAGAALGATGLAAALPEIDDPQSVLGRAYNKMVTHPIQTGIGVGLMTPFMATGFAGMNQSVTQPMVQTAQNIAGGIGAGALAHNALRSDMEKGRDSAINDFIGQTKRNVKSNMIRNTGIGAGYGALGGLVAATAANRLGNLGFDLGDYAKYTLAGAGVGGLGGYLSDVIGTNYDKDENYTD